MFIRLFIYVLVSLSAFAMSADQKRKVLIELAKPLPEDRVFYRWQSKASMDNLLQVGELNEDLYRYFRGIKHEAAGPGLYMSGNLTSSASYMKNGGGVIEVHVPKGTPYLDMESDAVLRSLSENGISRGDVLDQLSPEMLIKYDSSSDWWVVKLKKGVSFKPFTGSSLSMAQLNETISRMEGRQDPEVIKAFLDGVRPHVLSELKKDISLLENKIVQVIVLEPGFKDIFSELIPQTQNNPRALRGVWKALEKADRFQRLEPALQRRLIDITKVTESPDVLDIAFSVLAKSINGKYLKDELISSLIIRSAVPEAVKKRAIEALINEPGEPLAKMGSANRAPILNELRHQLKLSEFSDSRMVLAYMRLSLYDSGEFISHRNTLLEVLRSKNVGGRLTILHAIKSLPPSELNRLMDSGMTREFQKMLTSSARSEAEDVFNLLRNLESTSGFKGQYLNSAAFESLAHSPNADILLTRLTVKEATQMRNSLSEQTLVYALNHNRSPEASAAFARNIFYRDRVSPLAINPKAAWAAMDDWMRGDFLKGFQELSRSQKLTVRELADWSEVIYGSIAKDEKISNLREVFIALVDENEVLWPLYDFEKLLLQHDKRVAALVLDAPMRRLIERAKPLSPKVRDHLVNKVTSAKGQTSHLVEYELLKNLTEDDVEARIDLIRKLEKLNPEAAYDLVSQSSLGVRKQFEKLILAFDVLENPVVTREMSELLLARNFAELSRNGTVVKYSSAENVAIFLRSHRDTYLSASEAIEFNRNIRDRFVEDVVSKGTSKNASPDLIAKAEIAAELGADDKRFVEMALSWIDSRDSQFATDALKMAINIAKNTEDLALRTKIIQSIGSRKPLGSTVSMATRMKALGEIGTQNSSAKKILESNLSWGNRDKRNAAAKVLNVNCHNFYSDVLGAAVVKWGIVSVAVVGVSTAAGVGVPKVIKGVDGYLRSRNYYHGVIVQRRKALADAEKAKDPIAICRAAGGVLRKWPGCYCESLQADINNDAASILTQDFFDPLTATCERRKNP